PLAQYRARRIAKLPAGAPGHARNAPARDRARVGHARRAVQGGNPAERRSDRQRNVTPVRPRGAGGRAQCHRRAPPQSCGRSGRTVVRAFYEAGFWALTSIIILLWLVLRRFGDVLLTIIPLLMAGVVTMELMVLFGMKLNFANIIALPLLLGVGVAFKIYYIM